MGKLAPGTLYLIPTPLGETAPSAVLTQETILTIHSLKWFIVEERKTARRFLRKTDFSGDLDDERLMVFNEHSDRNDLQSYIQPLLDGENVGLMSEAGVPCVADPGSELVALAHRYGIPVVPLTGPSSLLLALMASGFNGQQFVFHGYLPIDRRERQQKIREIEKNALALNQTQIFIETPYRNDRLLETLVSTCKPTTLICVARELTTPNEQVTVKTAASWKSSPINLGKSPAVFLLYHSA